MIDLGILEKYEQLSSKNQDIIKPIYNLLQRYSGKISFRHVYAHTNKDDHDSKCNSVADRLAVTGSRLAKEYYEKKLSNTIINTKDIDEFYDSKSDQKEYSISDIQIKTKKRRKRLRVDIEI